MANMSAAEALMHEDNSDDERPKFDKDKKILQT